jgi:hypothetical protein
VPDIFSSLIGGLLARREQENSSNSRFPCGVRRYAWFNRGVNKINRRLTPRPCSANLKRKSGKRGMLGKLARGTILFILVVMFATWM